MRKDFKSFNRTLYWISSYFIISEPSSSIPIEKSLQFFLFLQTDSPACQAFLRQDTNCISSPFLLIKKCEETLRSFIFLK